MNFKLPSWLRWAKPFLIGPIDGLLRGRILHSPDSEIAADATVAGVTVAQWRAVEAQQTSKVDTILAQM